MRFPGFSKDGCFFSVSFPLRFLPAPGRPAGTGAPAPHRAGGVPGLAGGAGGGGAEGLRGQRGVPGGPERGELRGGRADHHPGAGGTGRDALSCTRMERRSHRCHAAKQPGRSVAFTATHFANRIALRFLVCKVRYAPSFLAARFSALPLRRGMIDAGGFSDRRQAAAQIEASASKAARAGKGRGSVRIGLPRRRGSRGEADCESGRPWGRFHPEAAP